MLIFRVHQGESPRRPMRHVILCDAEMPNYCDSKQEERIRSVPSIDEIPTHSL